MEAERALLLSQQTKICLCPQPQESGSHLYVPYFNLALPFSSTSYKLLFLHVSIPHPYRHFFSPTCVTHLILFVVTSLIIRGEENKSYSSTLCTFLHPPVTFSLTRQTASSATYSPTLSLPPPINITVHVSHPYESTGEVTVPYILTFIFIKWEDRSDLQIYRAVAKIPKEQRIPAVWVLDERLTISVLKI